MSGRPELSSKDLLLSSHHSWQNSVPWGCGAEGSRFLLAVVHRPPSALEAVLHFLPLGPPNMAMWFLQTLQGRESFCKVEITTTYNTIMRVTLYHYWLKGRNRSCPHSRGDWLHKGIDTERWGSWGELQSLLPHSICLKIKWILTYQ